MEGVSMSFGKMNSFIDIIDKRVRTDEEGFKVQEDEIVASVRAYREGRHGSERWANRAAFTDATTLFRFRSIPGITVTTAMVIVCGEDRFEITSVEDVKSRGMYVEALAREVKPSGKG
jgi:head-tail adaptor